MSNLLRIVTITCIALGVAGAAEAVTMTGSYSWGKKTKPDYTLKGVFTPGAEVDAWTVEFFCDWKGKPRTWKGTATGNPTAGEFKGEATIDSGKRTWSFTGTGTDGILKARHAELKNGEPRPSGGFILKLATE